MGHLGPWHSCEWHHLPKHHCKASTPHGAAFLNGSTPPLPHSAVNIQERLQEHRVKMCSSFSKHGHAIHDNDMVIPSGVIFRSSSVQNASALVLVLLGHVI